MVFVKCIKCVNGCPLFRTILFVLQTPTQKLAKYLQPILKLSTTNKYKVKYLFNFVTEIVDQDSSNLMGSLDIDSLFTNVPIEETIENCKNNLFKNKDTVHGLKKVNLKIFSLQQQKSRILHLIIQYTNKLTEWLWDPLIANTFLAYRKQNCLDR